MPISIHRASSDDWPLYREARLASLQDAPEAFGATLQSALTFDEEDWRFGVSESTWVAVRDSRALGMIRLTRDDAGRAHLSSMWVAPELRGQGVGVRLIDALEQEARRLGESELVLRVVAENEPARRLYARVGFVDNGGRHMTSRGQQEIEMAKAL